MSEYDKQLEFVYAEIKHHLDNVLADEVIETIIQMLKEYPNLKEKLEKIEYAWKNKTHPIGVYNELMEIFKK